MTTRTHILCCHCGRRREHEQNDNESHPCHGNAADREVPPPKAERSRDELRAAGSDAEQDGHGIASVQSDDGCAV